MIYKLKNKCFILVLVAFSVPAIAQKNKPDDPKPLLLTMDQVWERLQESSTAIQIKKIQENVRIGAIKDAKTDRLPDFEVEGEYARVSNMPVYSNGIFSTPKQFPVLHTYYKVGGTAYFNLYNGNQSNLEISKRKTELKVSVNQKEMTISEMKLRSAAYYLDMQRSLVFKDYLIKDILAQQKQLLQIKTFYKNGVILKSDVLRAELKLSKQDLALDQLENDLAIANQNLNTLIGLPDGQQVSPVAMAVNDTVVTAAYTGYLDYAFQHAYRIKISEQGKALAELALKSVKANVSPKIGLFANYAYSYPQIFLYPYSASLYGFGMAGVKASFPIGSIYKNRAKEKIARLENRLMDLEAVETQDQIRDEVNENYLRLKEAVKRIQVTERNVGQASENQRIIQHTYFNHLSLITDLLDADTQLLQAHFDLAAAKIAARLQYYQLLNITGKL